MTLPTLTLGTTTPGTWVLVKLTDQAIGKVPDGLTAPIKLYEERSAALDKAAANLEQTTVDLEDVLDPDLTGRIARAAASHSLGSEQKHMIAHLRSRASRHLVSQVSINEIYDLLNTAWTDAHNVLQKATDYTEIPAAVYTKLSPKQRETYDAATEALQRIVGIRKAHDHYLRLKDSRLATQALGPAETIFWSKYNPTAAEYRNAEGMIWSEVNNPSTINAATLAFSGAGITAELAESPEEVVRRRAAFLDQVEQARTLQALDSARIN